MIMVRKCAIYRKLTPNHLSKVTSDMPLDASVEVGRNEIKVKGPVSKLDLWLSPTEVDESSGEIKSK